MNGNGLPMPILKEEQLRMLQRVLDSVCEERLRCGLKADRCYLAIAATELYRKGFREYGALKRFLQQTPMGRGR